MKKIFLFLCISFFPVISFAQSLHEINSIWTTQDQKKFQLKELRGSKVIIGMVYTGCPHACPMTIAKIKEIEKRIRKEMNYRVILASFDVKKDRPERLKKQLVDRNLDPSKWTFLAADSDEQARELALVLGISYKDIGDGDFSHSNVITLLNDKGEVISKLDGLNAEIEEFVKKLNEK